jgi:hypothetical protein
MGMAAGQVRVIAPLMATLALLAGPALADPPPSGSAAQTASSSESSSSDSAHIETVTIESRKALERRISSFVSAVTVHPLDESLGRWGNRDRDVSDKGYIRGVVPSICPVIAGLTRDEGQFMVKRLMQIAADAGALLGAADCAPPTFIVLVTANPEAVLKNLWGNVPNFFNDERGVAPIKRCITAERPVRVCYNAYSARGQLGTRLQWQNLRQIRSVIVAVDPARIQGVGIGQLTDYIALVGLIQMRENADLGDAPTILRLFTDSAAERQPGLTSWDQALLKALYATDLRSAGQLTRIKVRLFQDLIPSNSEQRAEAH